VLPFDNEQIHLKSLSRFGKGAALCERPLHLLLRALKSRGERKAD